MLIHTWGYKLYEETGIDRWRLPFSFEKRQAAGKQNSTLALNMRDSSLPTKPLFMFYKMLMGLLITSPADDMHYWDVRISSIL